MNYEQFYDNRDVISLFSGAMGLDIGLQEAGLNVVVGQDFEPACVNTMIANGHNVERFRKNTLQTIRSATTKPLIVCFASFPIFSVKMTEV